MHDKPIRILLMMDTGRSYERGLLHGILKYARLHGPFEFLRKMPVVSGGPRALTVSSIRAWKPDGVIWRAGATELDVKAFGLPTVCIPFVQRDPDLSNVYADDRAIGEAAARHLLEKGLRSFAYYGLGDRCFWSLARKKAFAGTVKRAGFEADIYDKECRSDSLSAWLRELPGPVGLMGCTDDLCLDCYEAARAAGLRIPRDVAIVGVGDDEIVCDFANPPLSSVRMEVAQAGYRAAQLLVQMIRGKAQAEDIVAGAVDVEERASTNTLAVKDPLVARAVQFIHTHLAENIHVDSVVNAVPLSRRALYKRFRNAVGRSIGEEIRHARMTAAARLLTGTNLSVAQIAADVGLEDGKNLARVFYRYKSTTPLKYRQRFNRL